MLIDRLTDLLGQTGLGRLQPQLSSLGLATCVECLAESRTTLLSILKETGLGYVCRVHVCMCVCMHMCMLKETGLG